INAHSEFIKDVHAASKAKLSREFYFLFNCSFPVQDAVKTHELVNVCKDVVIVKPLKGEAVERSISGMQHVTIPCYLPQIGDCKSSFDSFHNHEGESEINTHTMPHRFQSRAVNRRQSGDRPVINIENR